MTALENAATPSERWVCAPPFRAHLRHVTDATGLPWQVLAMRAGVSLSFADHLLHGRRGRPVRRITRDCAVRLITLTPAMAAATADEWVPADRSRALVRWLVTQGWSVPRVAAATGVPDATLRALLPATARHAPHQAELRLRALVAALDREVAARGAA